MGYPHEFGYSADTLKIRHQDIRRTQLQHASESVTCVLGFSARNRRVQRCRNSGHTSHYRFTSGSLREPVPLSGYIWLKHVTNPERV